MTLVSKNERDDPQHSTELSTVYFYEGSAPRVIALKDAGLQMRSPIPGAFSAIYGYQSKQEGFMAARAYADRHRLQFTVIDFLVRLDHKANPLMMKPEHLPQHDFIAFTRIARDMTDKLQEILARRLEKDGLDVGQVDLSKPQQVLAQRPELITSLLDEPGWEHLKVIVYPAKVAMSEKPLAVGTVPFRHWDAIQEATCRLNPNIQITLDPPATQDKAAPASSPAPKDRERPRLK